MTANQAPNPLPPTLPAGTKTTGGCVALETWKLRGSWYEGMTRWPDGCLLDQIGETRPEFIDWSTYKPAQPETGGAKPACSHARIDEGRMVCLDCGVDDMGRYTAEETDEQWLKRVVFELTGVADFSVWVFTDRSGQLVKTERFTVVFLSKEVSGRDVREIRMRLRDASWPLKDSPAGVGSAASLDGGASPVSPGEAEATEPTLAEATRYCAECRAPMKARPGREVCRYCDLRCGGHSDRPPHEAMRRREESARQRMALMDERERPRMSRWSWELERAHPWTAEDEP